MKDNEKIDIIKHNSIAWDKTEENELSPWKQPVSKEVIANARNGIAEVLLTNRKPVPNDWYMPIKDKKILCLACGGGQQASVFAAMGGKVTLTDISKNQLSKDMMVAKKEQLDMEIIECDMCDLSVFKDETFEMIFHPISNCFIPNPNLVWAECYRVLKKGGSLLSGFTNPILYLFDPDDMDKGIIDITNTIPYSDLEQLSKEQLKKRIANKDTLEYGHSLETLIGGQTLVGFAITSFYEDISNYEPIDKHIFTSMATKAVKF